MRVHILQIVKAVLAAAIISMAGVLVFSLVMELCSLGSGAITPVNQVLKIIAIALGGIMFIRGERGLLKGAVYGVAAVLVTYLLFSIIASSFSVTWLFVLEIALGAFVGAISGIIGVNIRRRG